MKKLFSVLAIAAVFAACNSSSSTEEVTPADSTATVAPATDGSMAPATDSTATTADSTGAAK